MAISPDTPTIGRQAAGMALSILSNEMIENRTRLPAGSAKATILHAVARAKRTLSLGAILRILHVSPARYHAWQRADTACQLEDRSSCPRMSPTQLTPTEVATIKELATSEQYRHMPVHTLSRYAQRLGKVCASGTTWSRLIRTRGWRRPRRRYAPSCG